MPNLKEDKENVINLKRKIRLETKIQVFWYHLVIDRYINKHFRAAQ